MSIAAKNVATLREVAHWWEDQAEKEGPYSHDYCLKQAAHYNSLADLSNFGKPEVPILGSTLS